MGVVDGQRVEVSPHDFEDEGGQRGRLEGLLESAHFVEDAAEGPDVALLVVRLSLAQFRGDVARGPDHAHRLALARQDLADAEIADFHVVQRLERTSKLVMPFEDFLFPADF